jgi:hypothetical protein
MRIVLGPRESFRYRGRRFINDSGGTVELVVLKQSDGDDRIEVSHEPYPRKDEESDAETRGRGDTGILGPSDA